MWQVRKILASNLLALLLCNNELVNLVIPEIAFIDLGHMLVEFGQVLEVSPPFVQSHLHRSVGVANLQVIGHGIGLESIDVRLNTANNQFVNYLSIHHSFSFLASPFIWSNRIVLPVSQSIVCTYMPL